VTTHPQLAADALDPVDDHAPSSPGPEQPNDPPTSPFAESSTIHMLYYYDLMIL